MVKQTVKNRIKFILGAILLFLVGHILMVNLVTPLFLLALVAYFKSRGPTFKTFRLINLSLLFVIIFATGYFIIKKGLHLYYIPFVILPMLTTLLFSRLELSFLLTLAASFAIANIGIGNSLYPLGMQFFINGILASILIVGARRRMAVIRVGLIVGIMQAVTLLLINSFWIGSPLKYLFFVINGIVSSIIVLGILPLFEYMFKTVTNISLLELADFNHPLLQRMILEAPGTYHHSLIVGNLSDAACGVVGANALLARIGAYYHDIGKLQKPDYFSENQCADKNLHDTLSPSMSKMVIMNHVKDGVDLARKHKLNPRLIDFIQQHHGNSLVYYFYRRALESLEEDQEIREEGFRYPGPKPNTKETAIVLLADSVEAATRALKDPTPKKVEEVVHKIINNKFIDRQIDECDLSLSDLEKISAIFIRILSGIYHGRINYPEETKSENNNKKSPKENSYQSGKDKKSSP